MILSYFDYKLQYPHKGLGQIRISYLDSAPNTNLPVIVVIHALTGNAYAFGDNGWWSNLIGTKKTIDITKFRVISFNIPGNGQPENNILNDPYRFHCGDIAHQFITVLNHLNIGKIHGVIGASLGGGIAWELSILLGRRLRYLFAIATDYQSSDWLIGMSHIQDEILKESKNNMKTARKMAMLFYRSPASLNERFSRSKNEALNTFNINSWLDHHGNKLQDRFKRTAYLTMNHLLSQIDIARNEVQLEDALLKINFSVVQIGINSDILFPASKMYNNHKQLILQGKDAQYHEIKSIHGHDAFLMEYKQLNNFLKPYTKVKNSITT